jgi:tryptophan synthase alpha chain
MNRIDKKFQELRKKNKKAFIAFITAGYPNLGVTEKLVLELSRIGVDIVELGVPFSDPMADGPIIQESSRLALKNKVNLSSILSLVEKVRAKTGIPICLMTYYNPIFCFGDERFIRRAKACGVDGVIVPDLPPEEASAFIRGASRNQIAMVCFIAPTTAPGRIKYISKIARGFIYYVSLTGVTGTRKKLPADLLAQIRRIKSSSDKPVCVGFGVSNPGQVRQVCKIADGVIVGSAIVKRISQNIGRPDLVKKVSSYILRLKG